jgi:hypothetical protein
MGIDGPREESEPLCIDYVFGFGLSVTHDFSLIYCE